MSILGCWVYFVNFILFLRWKILLANNAEPDQMPHYVASDLGQHCLLMAFYGFPGNNGLNRQRLDWLVVCFGLNSPLRQYFSLYRVVSQREGERVFVVVVVVELLFYVHGKHLRSCRDCQLI